MRIRNVVKNIADLHGATILGHLEWVALRRSAAGIQARARHGGAERSSVPLLYDRAERDKSCDVLVRREA